MNLFNKNSEPVFLKESSDAERQIEKLKEISKTLNEDGRKIIKQDIKNLEYGIIGEKKIAFELKNSHMPIYILHDLYLESDDLNSQIDFAVFTRKMCFIIECKNLYGNIEITNSGDFIRTTNFDGKKTKVGIYSPITQNKRHIDLIKKMREDNRNALLKFLIEKSHDSIYIPIVVLANPKTILNAKYAKKDVKSKVIRADQLISYIKKIYKDSKMSPSSDKKTKEWAQAFLELHQNVESDYTKKYEKYIIKNNEREIVVTEKDMNKNGNIENSKLYKELKSYRYKKSQEEKVKPYFVYNNNQLLAIISKMPKNEKELMSISGIGESKAKKYGCDILNIVKKYL